MKKLHLILLTIIIITLTSCTKGDDSSNDFIYNNESLVNSSTNERGTPRVQVYSLTEIDRNLPTLTTDNKLSSYPAYNNTITDSTLKNKIYAENEEFHNFDYLDANGYYYLNGITTGQSLFKHTAADNMYSTSLSDTQKAVVKDMHVTNWGYNSTENGFCGSITTGLYAPAGEIIKIEIPQEIVSEGVDVYIGAITSRGRTNDIPTTADFTRMPMRTKSFELTSTTMYVGTPLGGSIYFYNNGKKIDMDVTITGAVEETHYIVGATTEEDLQRTFESTAPMINIDIPGQLTAVLPKGNCGELSVEKMLEGIDQWDKMTAVSQYVTSNKSWYLSHGVSGMYDSYVAAGAAVAYINSSYSILPLSYAANFFDIYATDWGSYHEYNHHFYGMDIIDNSTTSEVNNNLITMLGYLMYTEFSAYRSTDSNKYNNWAGLAQAKNSMIYLNSPDTSYGYDLATYTTLLHSFGVDLFIEALKFDPTVANSNVSTQAERWFVKLVEVTGYDMTYYFNEYIGDNHQQTVSDEFVNWAGSKNLEMYIPVSSDLQVGQEINLYGDEYSFKTMQYFSIFEGQTLYLDNYILVPTGMNFEIVETSNVENGVLNKSDYSYKANFKDNTVDEFTMKIKVYNNEYCSYQTLIIGICHQTTGTLTSSVTTNIYNNIDGLSIDEIDLNNIDLDVNQSFNVTSPTWAWSLDSSYNYGLFVSEGSLFFDETENMTFYFRGKGDIQVYMGTSADKLSLVTSFSDQASYDESDANRSYTMNVEKDKKIFIKIVCNTNVRSEFGMGIMNDGIIENISDSNYYTYYSSKEEANSSYYAPFYDYNRYPLSASYDYNYDLTPDVDSGVEFVDENPLFNLSVVTGGTDMYWVTLGSSFTVDYNEYITANNVVFNSSWGHGDTPKGVEVWVGNSTNNLQLVYDGNINDANTTIVSLGDYYTFRYAKVVFNTNHYTSNRFNIKSVHFTRTNTSTQVSATNQDFLYTGKANIINSIGNYNGAIVEFDGQITYSFTGTYLEIFANTNNNYGSIEIKIDNGDWITIDLTSDVLTLDKCIYFNPHLESNTHTITIKSNGLVNINSIVYS